MNRSEIIDDDYYCGEASEGITDKKQSLNPGGEKKNAKVDKEEVKDELKTRYRRMPSGRRTTRRTRMNLCKG
jgi:hypothetical protein